MQLTLRHPSTHAVPPNEPHEFHLTTEPGIGSLVPVGGLIGRQVIDLPSFETLVTSIGCSVCGKPADDPIHLADDE